MNHAERFTRLSKLARDPETVARYEARAALAALHMARAHRSRVPALNWSPKSVAAKLTFMSEVSR